jgi:hypothetical protein
LYFKDVVLALLNQVYFQLPRLNEGLLGLRHLIEVCGVELQIHLYFIQIRLKLAFVPDDLRILVRWHYYHCLRAFVYLVVLELKIKVTECDHHQGQRLSPMPAHEVINCSIIQA